MIDSLIEDMQALDATILFTLSSLCIAVLLYVIVNFIIKDKDDSVALIMIIVFILIFLSAILVGKIYTKRKLTNKIFETKPKEFTYKDNKGIKLDEQQLLLINKEEYKIDIDCDTMIVIVERREKY